MENVNFGKCLIKFGLSSIIYGFSLLGSSIAVNKICNLINKL